MNACSPVPAWAWVSGVCCGERLPPTVAPSHFLWRFVKRSVPPIAARRRDGGEGIEVEFDDRLQGLSGCAVVQAVRQGVPPRNVFRLQGDEFTHRVAPALWPGSPVGGAPVADHRRWFGAQVACAIAGLALGVAERLLTLGLAASGHGFDLRYVTLFQREWGGRHPAAAALLPSAVPTAWRLRRLRPFPSVRCARWTNPARGGLPSRGT